MIAAIPRMSKIFARLLPTIFPKAISVFPLKLEIKLTASPGALVPNATMVNPITNSEILNLFAVAEVPSTR